MRLRMELFVDDIATTVAFYTGVLGFRAESSGGDYVSLSRGSVVLGLGAVAKLPESGDGPGFTRQRLAEAGAKGSGVEIVLELDDAGQVTELYNHCRAREVVLEELRLQPWGLHDFRLADPDGYYLRVTHGDASAAPASA